MIIDPNTHHPAPPPEIVRRLKQVDPRLGLAWGQTVDPKTDRLRDSWMLTMDWLPTDQRHRLVQDGKFPLDSCFDCLCFLPFDCSVDEAYGYVTSRFKQLEDRDDVKKMLERVHTYNREAREEAIRPTMELAEELFETNKHRTRSDAVRKHSVETQEKKDRRFREYVDQ